ncbi:hypothetical protein [Methanolobus chelungpuianus]|uniref:Uncharacterized protein n=1 Tax=Methanolobus chelungpuianus TaxID=502115 RepID=A0AAE3H9N1_9EURY|nr:hypothetical protein [Methanolobus chelungpuianus]MCQ6962169.1 hypothetical protein [Methanolobus chelungpuianus]
MIGVILLTAIVLILTAEAYVIFHPLSGHIPSGSPNDIETGYISMVVGILLPSAAAGLYIIAKQKKDEATDS